MVSAVYTISDARSQDAATATDNATITIIKLSGPPARKNHESAKKSLVLALRDYTYQTSPEVMGRVHSLRYHLLSVSRNHFRG